jgi:mRNA interferase MazF
VPVRQGDVYFVHLDAPCESEPGFPHYLLVVQSNDLNESDINTVVVCCLTTTLSRARSPGNVLLAPGEGGMPEQSVVNVSQMLTVNKSRLTDRRAVLDHVRMREVVAGIRLLLEGEQGLP